MKIKLSRSQWEQMGKKAGWVKEAGRSYIPQLISNEAKKLWAFINEYLTIENEPLDVALGRIQSKILALSNKHDQQEMKKWFLGRFSETLPHQDKEEAWRYYERNLREYNDSHKPLSPAEKRREQKQQEDLHAKIWQSVKGVK